MKSEVLGSSKKLSDYTKIYLSFTCGFVWMWTRVRELDAQEMPGREGTAWSGRRRQFHREEVHNIYTFR